MATAAEQGVRVSDFDYDLPSGRIARYPAAERDGSRLLALDRATGATRHLSFPAIEELIDPGDLLVVNESRVIPARLVGRKPTGAAVEVLLLRPAASAAGRFEGRSTEPGGDAAIASTPGPSTAVLWEAMVRPGAKLKPGRVMEVGEGLAVRIVDSLPGGLRLVELDTALPPLEALDRFGTIPLPPYLDRAPEPTDEVRYQTVYARAPGSVAAPTAGLHFTEALLERLVRHGVARASLTLHIGPGTFRPVDGDDPAEHLMHSEAYEVPAETADMVAATRARGGRVWAVGTTTVRALEASIRRDGSVAPGVSSTDLFIRPGHVFRVVDALITNFHLPRSTLLMLVAAFGGYARVMGAYREAVDRGYRFYSYGDAMVVADGVVP